MRDGNEWIVNGQKVWNSVAHVADYGMLLARADPDQLKHRGLTYCVADMKAPGVEVYPLRQIRAKWFNEVYLIKLGVPYANGRGWTVAPMTVINERVATPRARTVARFRPCAPGPSSTNRRQLRFAATG